MTQDWHRQSPVVVIDVPNRWPWEPYTCPKCFQEFWALFLFNRHVREIHGDRKL